MSCWEFKYIPIPPISLESLLISFKRITSHFNVLSLACNHFQFTIEDCGSDWLIKAELNVSLSN